MKWPTGWHVVSSYVGKENVTLLLPPTCNEGENKEKRNEEEGKKYHQKEKAAAKEEKKAEGRIIAAKIVTNHHWKRKISIMVKPGKRREGGGEKAGENASSAPFSCLLCSLTLEIIIICRKWGKGRKACADGVWWKVNKLFMVEGKSHKGKRKRQQKLRAWQLQPVACYSG